MLQPFKELIAQKRFAEAFEGLKTFLKDHEAHEEAHVMFLALALDLHVHGEALDRALHVYERLRGNAAFQILLGRLYFDLKDPARASKHLLLGYSLNPRVVAMFQLVQIYHQRMGVAIPSDEADVVFATGGYFIAQGFNGDSLKSKAVGGSESSLISLAREWTKMGRKVVVYCNCDEPGVFNGVIYRPNWEFFYARYQRPMKLLIALRYDEYLKAPIEADRKILWLQDVPQTQLYAHLNQSKLEARELVCLSQYHEKIWKEHFDLTGLDFFRSRNGFDEAYFGEAAARAGEGMIYASRPSRGLEAALEIHRRLREGGRRLKLKICTYTQAPRLEDDEEYKPFLRHREDPDILFLGALSKAELAGELASSSFMVYPNTSTLETSCVAAIEAMAAGCPVLTSDRGALAETVPDGVGGAIVNYSRDVGGFIQQFVEKCAGLIDDPARLAALKRSCREYAWSKYRWTDIAREWDNHYFK